MPNLSQTAPNLEAYRLLVETLNTARAWLRDELRRGAGAEWEGSALPAPTHVRLEQRREREAGFTWNADLAADLLAFAGFADMHEVIAANPLLLEACARLTPDPGMLRARFLELDTILERLAYARPVGEREIELLTQFGQRLPDGAGPELDAAVEDAPPLVLSAAPVPAVPAAVHEPPALPEAALPRPQPPVQQPPATPVFLLDSALARENDGEIMAALFLEVTAVAEAIWSEAETVHVPVWEQVRESRWYASRFTHLNLRPLSDFYEVIRSGAQRRAAGAPRVELHEYLKEHDFARLLLALREIFMPFQAAIAANKSATR
ncbi:MAG: hypothetical protein V1750_07840 [Acidobacteriota bacterium]